MVSRRSSGNKNSSSEDQQPTTYEKIMGEDVGGGHKALSARLVSFRKWVQNAGCKVHGGVCIVNGEATDGTRNAPVLVLGPPPSSATMNPAKPTNTAEGRCGVVDTDEDRVLYDRTIGCQIRTTREVKEGQVLMTVPRTVMVHPDLIAASDAGRAALACCEPLSEGSNFWDAFAHTASKQEVFLNKVSSAGGTQLLVKILQERKKIENAVNKAKKAFEEGKIQEYKLAPKGTITARAVYLLFLLQQRFSDEEEPMVATDYDFNQFSTKDDATNSIERIRLAEGTPASFGPYARTLPPSIALPMCWKRNELATLASCVTGHALLQEIAAQILTFSSDLIALLDAGLMFRFPHLFSPKILTWDRWLWAASCHMSRVLPSKCYLNRNEDSAYNHVVSEGEMFYSPPEIWTDLGVMIPLVDMLNHEAQESQIKWESPIGPNNDVDDMEIDDKVDSSVASITIQKRIKKGCQIYTTYDIESNQNLMLQYGFAQMANPADNVPFGWALQDGVGETSKPEDYDSLSKTDFDGIGAIYDTTDTDIVKAWWNEDRLALLQNVMKANPSFWTSLRQGKKMVSTAFNDGSFDPALLTALVVATMSKGAVRKYKKQTESENEGDSVKITIYKQHQNVLREYLLFMFTRKLERMLQNVSSGLKAHFNNVELWTKATEGGLDHGIENETPIDPEQVGTQGWSTFFDRFAYNAAMEVETRYYSLAPGSCVLTLYDGHLRSLQKSIDGVISDEAFKERIIPVLQDLDFAISDEDHVFEDGDDDEVVVMNGKIDVDQNTTESGKSGSVGESKNSSSNGEKKKKKKERQRERDRMKQGGPPAIKLHIGNLSYQTTQGRLRDYFGMRYGREHIFECHIPTERQSGKSRGFGFVTLSEGVALRILHENFAHEIDGRVVKLAESNTSIQARIGQSGGGGRDGPADRCLTCGYSAKYCSCRSPNIPGFPPMMGGPPPGGPMYPPDDIYGPGPGGPDMPPPYDYGRGGMPPPDHRRRSRSWGRGRSYSRSPSPRYRKRGDSRDRYHERRPRRSRSRSRSYGRNYGRSRSISRSLERSRRRRSRSYERDNRRSRRSRGSRRSSRYSRSRSRSVNRSRDRERERDRKQSGDGPNVEDSSAKREQSRSMSPPQGRGGEGEGSKRESKSGRRRSRSRERNSKSRKRSKGSRRSKDRKRRSRSYSRSRSFSRG